jgi:hypothetical protein
MKKSRKYDRIVFRGCRGRRKGEREYWEEDE